MNNLDQYYTKESTAKDCFNFLNSLINLNNFFLFEPSAGTGSFSNLFHKNSLAIDIDPKQSNILKEDFFSFNISYFNDKNVISIGNPPFGIKSTKAIKFFNKVALFSNYIAFIIPKTFKKLSIQNKLNLSFHLIAEKELEPYSFIYNNKSYDVPCVFQIYEKRNYDRIKIIPKNKSDLFEFTDKENADIAIRRVGRLAGKVILDFKEYKKSSNYFIKLKNKDNINKINDLYILLNNSAKNSAGNPSLSKDELINIVEKELKK